MGERGAHVHDPPNRRLRLARGEGRLSAPGRGTHGRLALVPPGFRAFFARAAHVHPVPPVSKPPS
jgi:hypothetical protein